MSKVKLDTDDAKFTKTTGEAEYLRLDELDENAREFLNNLTLERLIQTGWAFDKERLIADFEEEKAGADALNMSQVLSDNPDADASCDPQLNDFIQGLNYEELDNKYGEYGDNDLLKTLNEYLGVSFYNAFDWLDDNDFQYRGFAKVELKEVMMKFFMESHIKKVAYYVFSNRKMQEVIDDKAQEMCEELELEVEEMDLAVMSAEAQCEAAHEDVLMEVERIKEIEAAGEDTRAAKIELVHAQEAVVSSEADWKSAEICAQDTWEKACKQLNDRNERLGYS